MLFIKLFENGELRKNGKAKFSILIGGMEVYKGIVLSAAQTDAFLAIANDEKLICEKGCSDGIYQKRTARLPDLFRANEVLEQFVVAGKIYVDPVTYRYLDGQLIEKGIILPYEKTSNELDFLSYDIFTVQRMLFEQGYSPSEYTEERIFELFYELNKGIREYLALTDGFDSAFAEIEIREALGLYNFVSLEEQRRFDHCRKLKTKIYTNPVYSVLSEYRDILNIAYHNNLLCPFSAVSNSTTKVPPIESDNAVMILKYTSETLGRISTARTLKENVRLVQSKEAKAYHEKINEWRKQKSLEITKQKRPDLLKK